MTETVHDAFEEPSDKEQRRRHRRLARGRRELIVYSALVIGVSGATIVAINVVAGTADLPRQAVRFSLTCLLMWWLWSGSLIARWITVVLFGLGGLAASIMVVSAAAPSAFAWILAFMQATYLPLALRLTWPTAVVDYLALRRARRESRRARLRDAF
jgi:hypothetical protein